MRLFPLIWILLGFTPLFSFTLPDGREVMGQILDTVESLDDLYTLYLDKPVLLSTPLGEYSFQGEVTLRTNGMVLSGNLTHTQEVMTPAGIFPAIYMEFFYDEGCIQTLRSRVPFKMDTPLGKYPVDSISFFQGGETSEVFLGQPQDIPTPLGRMKVWKSLSFHENGQLHFLETVTNISLSTPAGDFTVNALAFNEDGDLSWCRATDFQFPDIPLLQKFPADTLSFTRAGGGSIFIRPPVPSPLTIPAGTFMVNQASLISDIIYLSTGIDQFWDSPQGRFPISKISVYTNGYLAGVNFIPQYGSPEEVIAWPHWKTPSGVLVVSTLYFHPSGQLSYFLSAEQSKPRAPLVTTPLGRLPVRAVWYYPNGRIQAVQLFSDTTIKGKNYTFSLPLGFDTRGRFQGVLHWDSLSLQWLPEK